MKIEMGESLFYSWLRHVKECQIVQLNWKVSSQWSLMHEDEIECIKETTEKNFEQKYGYKIYKQNASLSQIILQGESDAIGIAIQDGMSSIYAVDVAFHENGLNYGGRDTTVMKIINKCIRTAMCIYGFMDSKEAEIIFASPKINASILNDVKPCINDIQNIMDGLGYHFRFRLIANEDFRDIVLQPILLASNGIADTSELFLRSYQMLQMFDVSNGTTKVIEGTSIKEPVKKDIYSELKIGKIVQIVMRSVLESGNVSTEEIEQMQTSEYSKKVFDLQYPVLVDVNSDFEKNRYYSKQIRINDKEYYLCSQWFEVKNNNDRPFLLKWIEEHNDKL